MSRQLVDRLEVGSASGIALDKLLAILASIGCTLEVNTTDDVAAPDFEPPHTQPCQTVFDPYGTYGLDMALFDPPQGR